MDLFDTEGGGNLSNKNKFLERALMVTDLDNQNESLENRLGDNDSRTLAQSSGKVFQSALKERNLAESFMPSSAK